MNKTDDEAVYPGYQSLAKTESGNDFHADSLVRGLLKRVKSLHEPPP